MSTTNDKGMVNFINHGNAYGMRDLALGRVLGGFTVYVRGTLLREKRHGNERVFATPEAAIKAGQRKRG